MILIDTFLFIYLFNKHQTSTVGLRTESHFPVVHGRGGDRCRAEIHTTSTHSSLVSALLLQGVETSVLLSISLQGLGTWVSVTSGSVSHDLTGSHWVAILKTDCRGT